MNSVNIIDIVVDVLELAKKNIQKNMQDENINATGKTSDSLEVVVDGNTVILRNSNSVPFETTEQGRPPGRIPKNFTEIIYQWHTDKGLDWGSETEARKIAGAVAWGKIKKLGYGRPSGTTFGSEKKDVYTHNVEDVTEKIGKMIEAKIIETLK